MKVFGRETVVGLFNLVVLEVYFSIPGGWFKGDGVLLPFGEYFGLFFKGGLVCFGYSTNPNDINVLI